MRNMKYITYETEDNHKTGLIFPENIEHRQMFKSIANAKLIGAGFCSFYMEEDKQWGYNTLYIKCFGQSISLDIKSNEDKDALILQINYIGFDYTI